MNCATVSISPTSLSARCYGNKHLTLCVCGTVHTADLHDAKDCYPTNSALLINFRPSSDAEIFVNEHRLSMRIGAKTCKNVRATCMYSDRASILHTTGGGWARSSNFLHYSNKSCTYVLCAPMCLANFWKLLVITGFATLVVYQTSRHNERWEIDPTMLMVVLEVCVLCTTLTPRVKNVLWRNEPWWGCAVEVGVGEEENEEERVSFCQCPRATRGGGGGGGGGGGRGGRKREEAFPWRQLGASRDPPREGGREGGRERRE